MIKPPHLPPIKPFQALLLAAALAGSASALAHGDPAQAPPPGPVRQEQQDWGIAGDARAAHRTLVVTMADSMRFTPDRLQVRQGETVKIVLSNRGKTLHEFVLGTPQTLAAHAALMQKFPDMVHDEPYMAHVPAGRTGTIVWTFNRPGEVDFACLIAGHYQAGMVGRITVVAR